MGDVDAYMLYSRLAAERAEATIEILHEAWMLDTYDGGLRHNMRRSQRCFGCRVLGKHMWRGHEGAV